MFGHRYEAVGKNTRGTDGQIVGKELKKSSFLHYTTPWDHLVALGYCGSIFFVFVAFMTCWDFSYLIDANTIQVIAPFSLAIVMDGVALIFGFITGYLSYMAVKDRRRLRRIGLDRVDALEQEVLIPMHHSHANAHNDYNLVSKGFLVYLFGWIFWTCFNYGTTNQNFLLYYNKLTAYPSPPVDNTVAVLYLVIILKAYQSVSLALDIFLLAMGIDRTLAIMANDKEFHVQVSINNRKDMGQATTITPDDVAHIGASSRQDDQSVAAEIEMEAPVPGMTRDQLLMAAAFRASAF